MSANYNISTFLYDYWWFTSFMEQKGSISCSNSILKKKLCFQMIMEKTLAHFIYWNRIEPCCSVAPVIQNPIVRPSDEWQNNHYLIVYVIITFHHPQSTPHLENRIEITYIYRNNIQILVITNHIKKRT